MTNGHAAAVIPTILGLRVGDFLFRGIPKKVDLLGSIGQVCLLLMLNTAISFMAANKKMKMTEFNVLTINDL